ncbi:MAG TPA: leucyl aminopeptidase [candidate division Zixibacteria bacterium]|nr:leucyl aminopeptidase [candidate division Zixibacteria bacterium]
MRLNYTFGKLSDLSDKTIVLFVPLIENADSKDLRKLVEITGGAFLDMYDSGEFTGAGGETAVVTRPEALQCDRLILAGLGKLDKNDHDKYRRAAGTVSRMNSLRLYKSATFYLGDEEEATVFQAVIEGFILGSYELLKYKTGNAAKSQNQLATITFAVENKPLMNRLQKAVERGLIVAEGQTRVRDLADTPSNELTPRSYAELARKEVKGLPNLTCRVLDENAIKKERMGALLSVARGSDEPPRFIVLEYKGGRAGQKPIVLVGKGVTFDSGGISLKKSEGMQEMKGDMTGSAIVLMALVAAARLKLKQNIIGLTPLAENMPSAHATKPGDIVKSRKGLTIEIINTDAEGRLILADALDYANVFDPQAVIDIATLTGGALYVLGYSGAPIMGNNPVLMDRLRDAADVTAERVWEMPLWDDFHKAMKSSIADLKNSGGKAAATMTAGAFLENFIGDWPWAHVDIAYMDIEPSGRPYIPKGVTGIGLRLLVELLSNWKKL